MHIESNSNGDLQDLFRQLARHFSANENKISPAEASKCFLRLSLLDSVALIRLFFLLCPSFRSVLSRQGGAAAAFPSTESRPSGENVTNEHTESAESLPELDNHQNSNGNHGSVSQHLQSSQEGVCANNSGLPNTATHVLNGLDNLDMPGLSFLQQSTCEPQDLHQSGDSGLDIFTVNPSDTTALPLALDDMFGKTRLAACSEIGFTPNLRSLLEACRTDRGIFLRKVEESRAALPNGQGWRAAIAIKQENNDMRDLLSIYHRFECYNIYRHVVEAGYHTGEHWIRDKRLELAKKLCDDFPERFHNQKAANKCLNWVDQGCRYHEWTKMFSQVPEIGSLIALPTEIPRSAYTSRCTKEQMSAAAVRFMALGIVELVKDLELSELGNHIAQRLEEMTTGKQLCVNGLEQDTQRSPDSPRLSSFLGTPNLVQSEETATSSEEMVMCDDTAMWDQTELFILSDDNLSNYELNSFSTTCLDFAVDSPLSSFLFPFEEHYYHLNNTDGQMVT